MTTLAPEPVATDTGGADELVHTACECTPDIALCGTGVAELPWIDEAVEATCVVCRELEDLDCPRCS